MKVELRGVTKVFGEVQALRGIDLHVLEGVRVLVLIGPSGGGKSTLLRVLGGLEAADAGEISINGRALAQDPAGLAQHRRENGYLFQAFNLFPHLCLLRNVTLPLEKVHGWAAGDAAERGRECLRRLGLEGLEDRMPAELSGGQQQRGGLARAIAARPKLLILDEPTSALDPEMTAEVLSVIEELCDAGQEILMSTHEMGFAKAVADHVVFLAEGKVIEDGGGVLEAPRQDAVRRFLSRVMKY